MACMTISKSKSNIAFKGLRDWVERNDLTYSEIGELLDMTGENAGAIFRGKSGVRFNNIVKILNLTGLTYEEAFEPITEE